MKIFLQKALALTAFCLVTSSAVAMSVAQAMSCAATPIQEADTTALLQEKFLAYWPAESRAKFIADFEVKRQIRNSIPIITTFGMPEKEQRKLQVDLQAITEAAVLQGTLFEAILSNDLDLFKVTLSGKKHDEFVNEFGHTPVMCAAAMGRLEILQYCIEKCGASLHKTDSKGNSLLNLIVSSQNEEMFNYFTGYVLRQKPTEEKFFAFINHQNSVGITPLHIALTSGTANLSIVEKLLHMGADCMLVASVDGKTPLDRAQDLGGDFESLVASFLVFKCKENEKTAQAFEELMSMEPEVSPKNKSPKNPSGSSKQNATLQSPSSAGKKKKQLALKKIEKEKAEKAAKQQARLDLAKQQDEAKAAKLERAKLEEQEKVAAAKVVRANKLVDLRTALVEKQQMRAAFQQWKSLPKLVKPEFLTTPVAPARNIRPVGPCAQTSLAKIEHNSGKILVETVYPQQSESQKLEEEKARLALIAWQATPEGQLFLSVAQDDIAGAERVLRQGIMEQKSYVNSRDLYGNTPLLVAIKRNNLAMLSVLSRWGADAFVKNNAGQTVEELTWNNYPMLELLGAMHPKMYKYAFNRANAERMAQYSTIEQLRYENAQLKNSITR